MPKIKLIHNKPKYVYFGNCESKVLFFELFNQENKKKVVYI